MPGRTSSKTICPAVPEVGERERSRIKLAKTKLFMGRMTVSQHRQRLLIVMEMIDSQGEKVHS